jgi:hypothetical protein
MNATVKLSLGKEFPRNEDTEETATPESCHFDFGCHVGPACRMRRTISSLGFHGNQRLF